MINDDTHHGVLAPRFAALVSVLLAAAACSNASPDDSSPSSDDASMSAATVPPEAIENPEEAATAAYTRYWDVLTAAVAAPDGDYSEFEAISADQALEYASSIEAGAVADGTRSTGTTRHDISVKDSIATDEVTQVVVLDCADSTGMEVVNQDGSPVAGEEYGPQEVQARIELLDGFWIVTVMEVQEVGSCVPDD